MSNVKFISSLFIVWCYSFLYSLRLVQSSYLMFAHEWVSLCPTAEQRNARVCEPLMFVASGKREEIRQTHLLIGKEVPQLWTWSLACMWIRCSGVAIVLGWGKEGCGWAEFKNALSHKIYPIFTPPIPWLAAVSVIRKLPIRGFLYLLLHWPKDSCYT